MKKLFLFAGVITVLAVVSCKKDWLNPPPEDILIGDDSTFLKPENAVRFVNAAYRQLATWEVSSFSWIGVSSIISDDADKGSSPGDNGADKDQLDNFTYGPTTGSVREVWRGLYVGIGRCNQAIANVPKFNIDAGLKTRLIGEAKFLRALFYFRLVRMFGDVPKIDRAYSADSVDLVAAAYVRAPQEQIYDLIEQDLTDAINSLPAKAAYSAADLGRATKEASQGLLSKVYLYQKDWTNAMAMSDAVIATPGYNLEPDYRVIFRQSTENGQESLFEIQAQNGGEGWALDKYSTIQGARGDVIGGYNGWGFNTPTADLEAAYEPSDTIRKNSTMYRPGERLWDGALVSLTVENPRYNYKSYASQTMETNYNGEFSSKNYRELRFAEVLLINAEAANELDQGPKARTSLNRVRARARGGVAGAVPDVTTTDKTALRNAIWHERRVEMGMEHDRFFDLVRQGRAGPVMRAHGKAFVDGKHELFPIPLDDILISQGRLTQNPGY